MLKSSYILIRDAVDAYDRGSYNKALTYFDQLKNWYPFSKYAILAELKIGDSHYYLKEYPEAISAYEEFERLHPRNEAIPYVIYQIGRCYYEQLDTIDRDQTPTVLALKAFQRLEQNYPDDPHSKLAQTHIIACWQSITGHELYVGRYYLKGKRYKAAMARFMNVITQYPDVGNHYKALQYIALCRAYLEAPESDPPEIP